MAGWRFWIDRGGTFTDIVAEGPDGEFVIRKLLSVNRERYEDAALEAIRAILHENGTEFARIHEVKLGTTVATNALLERKGAKVAFAVTKGFADAIEIGQQARANIFALNIIKPDVLYSSVLEVDERILSDGTVERPLDEDHVRNALIRARNDGFTALAVSLLHGWAFPQHEIQIGAIAREVGFSHVSIGSEVSRLIRFVPRTDTTLADAYLSPVLDAYIERFAKPFDPKTRLLFMQSNGGLAELGRFRGRDAVLSGPAGGVVGMAAAAQASGFDRALGFDMGGTSTDVSHFAGAFERTKDSLVAGVRFSRPMLEVHTVAAGGGSICFFDGQRLRVGPESAGSDPGPACYRRGGPLTVTDCNVFLGRIQPQFFPSIFGPTFDQSLDHAVVVERLDQICSEILVATGQRMSAQHVAEGFLTIANLSMAEAIKKISIQRGYDPADYALVAFGGAGGQHACAVAEAVGVRTIVLHPLAGVMSAWGIGLADVRAIVERSLEEKLTANTDVAGLANELAREAREALARQADGEIDVLLSANVRYEGADTSLSLPLAAPADLIKNFHDEHRKRFGFIDPLQSLVVSSLSAEAVSRSDATTSGRASAPSPATGEPVASVDVFVAGSRFAAPAYARAAIGPGFCINGPALILENGATGFVAPGWRADMDQNHALILSRQNAPTARETEATTLDPILLEVFNNLFMSIAEEMGLALQSTASSVNIKERLDFSCAIFDETGGLVANAPHIPVHLGSMSDSVREIIERRGAHLMPGDVFMLNAPHAGGTHLPDITVIAPVFIEGIVTPAFFVAARGHHADIGGIQPGSMPPDSVSVDQEGIEIENFQVVEKGHLLENEIRLLFSSGPYPARNIERNIADLKAQIASCVRGQNELERLVGRYGYTTVRAYMGHVQDNAEEQIRRAISKLQPGNFSAPMDNGATISVAIIPDLATRNVTVDFTGTSEQQNNNFNAPLAITKAAVLYVFRCLVDDAIPLNEGCLRPIKILVPSGSMLNPVRGAAVVAGNVETSQIIVDALFGALGKLAASQGTMNNFTFGNDTHQYYETICGGAGAGDGFCGASAVQTHMTNSRLTDPEVIESRFPIIVDEFAIRRGSGGVGKFRGGDGALRRIRFREPMSAAMLSGRRSTQPFGVNGGGSGLGGVNRIVRKDGTSERLAATAKAEMAPGDIFEIETPGGGGFGALE